MLKWQKPQKAQLKCTYDLYIDLKSLSLNLYIYLKPGRSHTALCTDTEIVFMRTYQHQSVPILYMSAFFDDIQDMLANMETHVYLSRCSEK